MKIALIGYGNLGRAVAQGLTIAGFGKEDIVVCARSEQSVAAARCNGFTATRSVALAVADADVIFLALKAEAFYALAPTLCDMRLTGTVVSLMAGVCVEQIRKALRFDGAVVRAMPNLAIAAGNGIVGHTKTDDAQIARLFSALGFSFEVDEADIEKITAFSACGLGFAAYVLGCFIEAGQALGLDETLCDQIVRRNFQAALAAGDLGQTVSAVATKGGATEQGLSYLRESHLSDILSGAVQRAYGILK